MYAAKVVICRQIAKFLLNLVITIPNFSRNLGVTTVRTSPKTSFPGLPTGRKTSRRERPADGICKKNYLKKHLFEVAINC